MAPGIFNCLFAEFIGTFLLVFTVGGNVLSGSPLWAGLSIGLVLMVTVYALGPVSGANFNPAVSLALGICGKLPWVEVGTYIVTQIVAGVSAGLVYQALFGKVFKLAPSPNFGWYEVMLAEGIYTFMLCFVVLNCAASKRNNPPENGNEFFGLAIGFVIIAGAYGAGSISGGAFNPAVAMGIEATNGTVKWGAPYIAFQLAGSLLAAVAFRIVRPDESSEMSSEEPYSLGVRVISEIIGTYMLVLTVGLNVLGQSPAPAFSIAASLTSMIYSLGDVSGAHFNPAVTLAIVLSGRRKCELMDAGPYVLGQMCGGILAGFTFSMMHNKTTFPLEPGTGFTWTAAAAAELVFTFVLCFVVLTVATVEESATTLFGLAIGSCVTVGGSAIGAVSGGSLNPAVSAGIGIPDSVIAQRPLMGIVIYAGVELLGAVVAGGLFRVTHAVEFQKSAARRK